jgi:YVTN family beta-propeller protein
MRSRVTRALGTVTVMAALGFVTPATVAGAAAVPAGARRTPPPTIYIAGCVDCASGKVTPFHTATNHVGKKIPVGQEPFAIAVTPDGKTVYAVNSGSDTVTPINTATNTAGPAIPVGLAPVAIAVTPDGKTAYVVNYQSSSVTPIDTATNTAGRPIGVGAFPYEIAISPDGRTAYVAGRGNPGTVTPIDTATNTPGPAITMNAFVGDIVFTPDSKTAYVAASVANCCHAAKVIPINVVTNTAGRAIHIGAPPRHMAITPNGATLYVTLDKAIGSVVPVSTATNKVGKPISAGNRPTLIAITPDGTKAYVASQNHSDHNGLISYHSVLTSITIATGAVSRRIVVASGVPHLLLTMAFTPNGATLYALGYAEATTLPGFLVAVDTATNKASRHFPVGLLPSSMAITP